MARLTLLLVALLFASACSTQPQVELTPAAALPDTPREAGRLIDQAFQDEPGVRLVEPQGWGPPGSDVNPLGQFVVFYTDEVRVVQIVLVHLDHEPPPEVPSDFEIPEFDGETCGAFAFALGGALNGGVPEPAPELIETGWRVTRSVLCVQPD